MASNVEIEVLLNGTIVDRQDGIAPVSYGTVDVLRGEPCGVSGMVQAGTAVDGAADRPPPPDRGMATGPRKMGATTPFVVARRAAHRVEADAGRHARLRRPGHTPRRRCRPHRQPRKHTCGTTGTLVTGRRLAATRDRLHRGRERVGNLTPAQSHPQNKETPMASYMTSTDPVSSIRASIVRTIVPVVVGAIITLALRVNVDLDSGVITELVTTVVTVVYYAVVRLLETRVAPAWGWLLGYAQAPTYGATAKRFDA